MTLEPYEIPDALLYVGIVMVLFVAGSVHAIYRIKGSKEREAAIVKHIGEATDKIAATKEIARSLLSAGKAADGRLWFALYRVGQIQDPVGWAIRDVLLDPDLKNYDEGSLAPPPKDFGSSSTEGPGIS
jgi:hypothetical protein